MLQQAIVNYGASRRHLNRDDSHAPDTVYQIGVAPNQIDILTSIDGVQFDEAWSHRKLTKVDDTTFFVIGRDQLLKNKRATGWPKDLADVAWLEEPMIQ